MAILDEIVSSAGVGKKQLAFLLDPDKYQGDNLLRAIDLIGEASPDLVLVGGSLVQGNTPKLVALLKERINQPVVLYPGSLLQLVPNADAILFISLISGRNADFLIGNHVVAAPILQQSALEIIPTGYMLIDGGNVTSVQYMSNTMPIPANKPDIAVATALAGEYLGLKLIYMDAGSGAINAIASDVIGQVKAAIKIPLMVGGGINTIQKVKQACDAGADLIVVGNAIEKDPGLLRDFSTVIRSYQ